MNIEESIQLKKDQIADAKAWVKDIKEMMAEGIHFSREEINGALNYVIVLQNDLLKHEMKRGK